MSIPNSNFEGNFSIYVFGKSFWHYRELKSECWASGHILCKKILNIFICVEVRILCKKVKYVWSSYFPEAITTKMQIWIDTFVFKYPVTCKQKISKFTLICIWILVFPIGIIQVSTARNWSFLLHFSSLHEGWPPTTLISLVHNSLCEMERSCFSASQNAKNESQLKHKNQVRNRHFIDS